MEPSIAEVISIRIRRDAAAGGLCVAPGPRAGWAYAFVVCVVMGDQVAGRSAAQRAAGSCEGGQQCPRSRPDPSLVPLHGPFPPRAARLPQRREDSTSADSADKRPSYSRARARARDFRWCTGTTGSPRREIPEPGSSRTDRGGRPRGAISLAVRPRGAATSRARPGGEPHSHRRQRATCRGCV